MKKISLTLALFTLLGVASCKEKETVHTETVTERTETVDDPADTVVIKETDQAPDGTDVKIDSSGISVETRNNK